MVPFLPGRGLGALMSAWLRGVLLVQKAAVGTPTGSGADGSSGSRRSLCACTRHCTTTPRRPELASQVFSETSPLPTAAHSPLPSTTAVAAPAALAWTPSWPPSFHAGLLKSLGKMICLNIPRQLSTP